MYLQDYIWFLGALVLCMIFSGIASGKVRSAFAKYDKIRTHSGMTGSDTAMRLMNVYGVHGISIGCVKGSLTDHYHPKKSIVNLSESTYHSGSVAAVAVAAHEIGHVMQRQDGYSLYRLRTVLVPVVNIGTNLAMPLVLVGMLLDIFVMTVDSDLGFYVAMLGVAFYAGSMIFALVTLPVELDASKRARQMLLDTGVLTADEIPAAKEVLSAAALTYLASLLTSIVYFLRFLFYVLSIFGRRRN